ncbi:phosphotriesterase [Rhodococcus koreensis]|uniref:phosphotriesterase family protein n=1 Tax=Rhodococcus koreensis TaxID=99653 RepID=UPI00366AF831
MTSAVETVKGPVAIESLGVTLPHEHIFLREPEVETNYPNSHWDEAAKIDQAVAALDQVKAMGVDTLVDLTVLGLGRDISLVQKVAARTDINICVATGSYTFNQLPTHFELRGPGRLVDMPRDPLETCFIDDITVGIAGTGVKAAMIKVATDSYGITPDVARVLRAAAVAHRETGVTITTHTHAEDFTGRDQQAFLKAEGVPLDRVVIGHSGDSTDVNYLRELMDNGSTIGLDRFGAEILMSDEARIEVLLRLIELGYSDRLTLSHDAFIYSANLPDEFVAEKLPKWKFTHLFTHIVPALYERGVSEETIRVMTVDNPARMLRRVQ